MCECVYDRVKKRVEDSSNYQFVCVRYSIYLLHTLTYDDSKYIENISRYWNRYELVKIHGNQMKRNIAEIFSNVESVAQSEYIQTLISWALFHLLSNLLTFLSLDGIKMLRKHLIANRIMILMDSLKSTKIELIFN